MRKRTKCRPCGFKGISRSTGTVGAATIGYSNMAPPWNFWDIADYFIENIPVQLAVFFVVMNKERYENLSPEHRAIIDDISGETFSLKGSEIFQQAEDSAEEAMKTADQMQRVAWIYASPEDRAALDAAVAEGSRRFSAILWTAESRTHGKSTRL